MEERYLKTREVARRLSLGITTLRRWRQEGKGPRPYVKVGGAVRYPESVVDEWIKKNLRQHTSDN